MNAYCQQLAAAAELAEQQAVQERANGSDLAALHWEQPQFHPSPQSVAHPEQATQLVGAASAKPWLASVPVPTARLPLPVDVPR